MAPARAAALAALLLAATAASAPSDWAALCQSGQPADQETLVREVLEALGQWDRETKPQEAAARAWLARLAELVALPVPASGGALWSGDLGAGVATRRRFCLRLHFDTAERLIKNSNLLANLIQFAFPIAEATSFADALLTPLLDEIEFRIEHSSANLIGTPAGEGALFPLVMAALSVASSINSPAAFARMRPEVIFGFRQELACYWVSAVFRLFRTSMQVESANQNLLRLMTERSFVERFHVIDEHVNTIYYTISYINAERDRELKRHINLVLQGGRAQNDFLGLPVKRRGPKGSKGKIRVAVVTQFWFERHSVYRTLARYVESLSRSPRFYVELLYLSHFQHDAVTAPFAKATSFDDPSDLVVAERVLAYCRDDKGFSFHIVFFPDVGMSWPSMYLANRRLAPLAVAGVGHSVSTFGSLVDFYVSGDMAEMPRDEAGGEPADAAYSETLLLLPGAGVVHSPPRAKPSKTPMFFPKSGRLRINIAATAQKLTPFYLGLLRRVLEGSRTPLLLRFFPALSQEVQRQTLKKNVIELLGLRAEPGQARPPADPLGLGHEVHMMTLLDHSQYLAETEKSHLFLEPFHYGGCNTIVDAVTMRKPIVTLQGRKWNNRVGSHIMRQFGLDSLVTTSPRKFVRKVLRLVNDPAEFDAAVRAVAAVDVNATLFSDSAAFHLEPADTLRLPEPDYFALALLHLHDTVLPSLPKPPTRDGPRLKGAVIRLREVLRARPVDHWLQQLGHNDSVLLPAASGEAGSKEVSARGSSAEEEEEEGKEKKKKKKRKKRVDEDREDTKDDL